MSVKDTMSVKNPNAGSVTAKLTARITSGALRDDAAQREAAASLDGLLDDLRRWQPERRLFRRAGPAPKGIYIWGRVGRGKSMLMDWFYEDVAISAKRRVHFHEFMLEVHQRIASWRKMSTSERRSSRDFLRGPGNDPIAPTARAIARDAKVLCFDEFHVTNIADAMILGRLFTALWEEENIVVVATSNRAPDELYKNGLNRALFEPFIALIPQHMEVLELWGDTDHRLRQLTKAPVYYQPLGASADAAIEAAWQRLTGAARTRPASLNVQGRTLTLDETAAGVARAEFDRLCGQPIGAADYLALAHAFQTLILQHVPVMGPDMRNEAQRFTWLIDALYETRTKLVMSAAAPPDGLYRDGDGSFEFARTASRLMEMQSADYLGARRQFGEGIDEGLVEGAGS